MAKNWKDEDLLSIRERVFRHIKKLILEGKYDGGDRLVERELAEELKVSRTPIREALFRLESQGFVEIVPRKGVIVSSISEEEVIEIFILLSTLESLAVRLTIQKLDKKTKTDFLFYIDKVKKALSNKNEIEFTSLHVELNYLLYKSAKSPKLYEILSGLLDHIRAFSKIGYETPGRQEEAMKEHLNIMNSIYNSEMGLAEYYTKAHIENSKLAYIKTARQKKDVLL